MEGSELYDEFMGKEGENTAAGDTKKTETKKENDPDVKKTEKEETPSLEMWEFIHDKKNGNVTMGAEMFQTLMSRLIP